MALEETSNVLKSETLRLRHEAIDEDHAEDENNTINHECGALPNEGNLRREDEGSDYVPKEVGDDGQTDGLATHFEREDLRNKQPSNGPKAELVSANVEHQRYENEHLSCVGGGQCEQDSQQDQRHEHDGTADVQQQFSAILIQ